MAIRVRLTRRRTTATRIVRCRRSGDTPRPLEPFSVEGILARAVLQADGDLQVTPARTLEEGIDYDQPLALLLEPGDDGAPRTFVCSPVRLITVGDGPDYVPLVVETHTSEYTVLLLSR